MKNLKNKTISKIFIYLALRSLGVVGLIIAPACVNKKKINIQNNKKQTTWNYDIGIEGIECKLCAYKALKRLEKIEHVDNVKIICTPNFRDCHANLEYKNISKNINIQVIVNAIATEGFEVKYISGNLIGMFDDKYDKFSLFDQSLDIKFMNQNGIDYMLPINQKTIVNAKLIFQKQLNQVWLQMN